MGVFFSSTGDKVAYYKDQANKARLDSVRARAAGNNAEADRLDAVAKEADVAAVMAKQQLDEATR